MYYALNGYCTLYYLIHLIHFPLEGQSYIFPFLFSDAKDIDGAFKVGTVISVDRSKTPKTLQIKIGKTDPAIGEIDETFLLTHTGSVSFPDENNKKYNFWYYPAEGVIYWSRDKVQYKTGDYWTGETDENGKLSRTNIFLFLKCFKYT